MKKSKRLQKLRGYSLDVAQLKAVKAGNCCPGDGSHPPPAQATTAYTKPKTIVGG